MGQQPDEFFNRVATVKHYKAEATAYETHYKLQSQPAEQSAASSSINVPSPELLTLAVLSIFFSLYIILYRKVCKPKETRTPYQYRLRIPCKHCRFYSPNSHLQCAVHPSRVLRFDAVHCPDYYPRYDGSYRNSSLRK